MSCGKTHGRHENCVCDAVEKILAEQEAVEEQCPTGCYTNLLNPTIAGKDTIPFLLFDKKGGLFSTFGNVGDLWMICNALNPFSSALKNYATAAQHCLFYALSMSKAIP
ncbi:Spore coat protein Y [Bacillus subtilis subsp. subtilis]|nr:Spore coat protein Y [Bacillus subtilis subsp. subtilis]